MFTHTGYTYFEATERKKKKSFRRSDVALAHPQILIHLYSEFDAVTFARPSVTF